MSDAERNATIMLAVSILLAFVMNEPLMLLIGFYAAFGEVLIDITTARIN